jgi:hypothetical protein
MIIARWLGGCREESELHLEARVHRACIPRVVPLRTHREALLHWLR